MRFLVEVFGYSHSCSIGLRPPQGTTGGMCLRINKLSTDFTLASFRYSGGKGRIYLKKK